MFKIELCDSDRRTERGNLLVATSPFQRAAICSHGQRLQSRRRNTTKSCCEASPRGSHANNGLHSFSQPRHRTFSDEADDHMTGHTILASISDGVGASGTGDNEAGTAGTSARQRIVLLWRL